MSAASSDFFRHVLNVVQTTSPENLSYIRVDPGVIDLFFETLSNPSSELTNDLRNRIIQVIGGNAFKEAEAKGIVQHLFKENLLSTEDRHSVVTACSKSPTFLKRIIENATPQEVKELLFDPKILPDLIKKADKTEFTEIIKALNQVHPELTKKLFVTSFNNTPFLSLLLNEYHYDLINELTSSSDPFFKEHLYKYLESNNVSAFTLSKLRFSLEDWPTESLKVFLSQVNNGSTRLEDLLGHENSRASTLKRLSEFPTLPIELGLLAKYATNTHKYRSILETLLKDFPAISRSIPPVMALELRGNRFLAPYLKVTVEEALQSVDQKRGEKLAQNEWGRISNEERVQAISILINEETSYPFIRFLIANGYLRDLLSEHHQLMAKALSDETFISELIERTYIHHFLNKLTPETKEIFLKTVASMIFPTKTSYEAVLLNNLESLFEVEGVEADLHKVLKGKLPFLDFLSEISEISRPYLIALAEEALKSGLQPTETALRLCIQKHNRELLSIFLKQLPKETLEAASTTLVKDLSQFPDEKIEELLLKAGLNVHAIEDSLVEELIASNMGETVQWLFEKGLVIKTEAQGELLFKRALSTGNLELIELIWSKIKDFPDLSVNYPRDLEISRESLKKYLLFSPLPLVFRVVERDHPELIRDLKMMVSLLPLLVRFPQKSYRTEVSNKLKNEDTYIDSSFVYAQHNFDFINAFDPTDLSWEEVLKAVIKERRSKNPQLRDAYGFYRKVTRNEAGTPLLSHEEDSSAKLLPDQYRTSRYTPAWNRFIQFRDERAKKSFSVEETPGKVFFTYSLPGQEPLTITQLDIGRAGGYLTLKFRKGIYWEHASSEAITQTAAHLSELHQKVMHFDLKEENQAEFFELVARAYWLISSLSETERGTPHNAMLWLNMAYHKHHLPPPIPKTEFFFLDNMMLVMPVEQAIEKWHTFFEPPTKL